jgi:prepilin-type N-terminal cleavage/methylation domain-containing protein
MTSRTSRHSEASPTCHPRRGGFTLVELLVVISIIVLMAAMAIPSVLRVRRQIARGQSLALINLLDGAVRQYRNDFDEVPPSDAEPYRADDSDAFDLEGRHLLVFLLTGYAGDPGESGSPADGSRPMIVDDGKSGWGLRTRLRGKVYGPYNGAENVDRETAADPNSDDLPEAYAFVDTFGNEVYYYRYDDRDDTYHADHNTDGPALDGGADVDDYVQDPDGELLRRDYILCTRGPDLKWGSRDPSTGERAFYQTYPAVDDVTNFLEEQ